MVLVAGPAMALVHYRPGPDQGWSGLPLPLPGVNEAACSMLAALATSMITVAALHFHSHAYHPVQVSSQYCPGLSGRICATGATAVLGSFRGIFA